MPCTGCKEKKSTQRFARQSLDARVMALLSEAAGEVGKTNPALASRLIAMNGEINAAGVREAEELRAAAAHDG